MKMIRSALMIGVALFASASVLADRAADEASIRKALGEINPDSIQATPVPGVYEVVVGAHVVYVTADGQYMFQGDLIDMNKRESLTARTRRKAQQALVQSVSEDEMIIFEPEKSKYTITVFTDIDCGYCRKLHRELDDFLDAGIRVRYMMFPRAGIGSDSYKKAVAVWCADDRNQALTDSKLGKAVSMKSCDNPIDQHMKLVEQLGIRGTPFIMLDNGMTQPGYVPAKRLVPLLEQTAQK
jgi:thiol:disulfide interchange protein DsbC